MFSPVFSTADQNGFAHPGVSPEPRRVVSNCQPALVGWTAQPATAYQLVPVESPYIGYQPMYAQQPLSFAFQSPMAVTPMPSTGHPMSSTVSPPHRQVSVGMVRSPTATSFFPQGQYHAPQYQQVPYHHQQCPSQSAPGQAPTSSVSMSQVPYSPLANQTYNHGVVFATPQQVQLASSGHAQDPPPTPATPTRLSLRPGLRMNRQNRPHPLTLRPRNSKEGASLHVSKRQSVPSVTPIASDGEYDGGGSSYSTSPLGSDCKTGIFGWSQGTAGNKFVPRMPASVRRPLESIPAGGRLGDSPGSRLNAEPPPSPTPRLRVLRRSSQRIGPSREKARDNSDMAPSQDLSSQDLSKSPCNECCDSNSSRGPDRSHGKWSREGSTRLRHCSMQQCHRCNLFISEPAEHHCLNAPDT